MNQISSLDRNSGVFLLVFFFVNVIFLFSLDFLPFIDLPNHLSEATIFKLYQEPGNVISQYYAPTPWYFPNTFHTVFCSLFPSVETGNVVFHLLYIALLQLSLWLAIRELNGNVWFGLLGLLFTYNYNVTYGFVGFAISIPTLILLFYTILKDIHKNTLLLKVVIAALLVMLFFMHAQNALLGLLLYGCMTLFHFRRSLSSLLLRGILVPLSLVIIMFAWWLNREPSSEEGSTFDYLVNYYTTEYFQSFVLRFRIFVLDNFQLAEGMGGVIIAFTVFLIVMLPVLYFRPWNALRTNPISQNSIHALIFFSTTFLCYLFLPDKLPGQTPLFQRFCTIVLLAFIIFSSTLIHHVWSKKLCYYVMVTTFIYLGFWFHYMWEFNQQNKGFNKAFFQTEGNSKTLAGLIYDNKYRGRKVYIHFPNYFLVWNKGIVASKIIDYRFGVVKRLVSEQQLPFYNELIGEGYKYHPEYSRMDYLLVRGEAPSKPDKNLEHFTLVRSVGLWKLYTRR